MKYRIVVEYDYPGDHKPPVKAELVLHGDRVVTNQITLLPECGRLIDADELENKGYDEIYKNLQYGACDGMIYISDVPTVLEASKNKN